TDSCTGEVVVDELMRTCVIDKEDTRIAVVKRLQRQVFLEPIEIASPHMPIAPAHVQPEGKTPAHKHAGNRIGTTRQNLVPVNMMSIDRLHNKGPELQAVGVISRVVLVLRRRTVALKIQRFEG